MIPLGARVESAGATSRLAALAATVDKYLLPALDDWQTDTLKEAMEAAAVYDAFNTNRLAIHKEKPGPYTRVVATGTNYARYLEDGIRGNQPRMPNVMHLFPWVQLKYPQLSIKEQDRQTYRIALHIKRFGLPPHPYMAPTADIMLPRGEEMIAAAVQAGIDEINGGAYV